MNLFRFFLLPLLRIVFIFVYMVIDYKISYWYLMVGSIFLSSPSCSFVWMRVTPKVGYILLNMTRRKSVFNRDLKSVREKNLKSSIVDDETRCRTKISFYYRVVRAYFVWQSLKSKLYQTVCLCCFTLFKLYYTNTWQGYKRHWKNYTLVLYQKWYKVENIWKCFLKHLFQH